MLQLEPQTLQLRYNWGTNITTTTGGTNTTTGGTNTTTGGTHNATGTIIIITTTPTGQDYKHTCNYIRWWSN